MDVSCGSSEGRYLFNSFCGWVGSDPRGGAIEMCKYSVRGPAMRATYPGNGKRPQTQVKSGGRRISMGLGVNVAWGGPRGFHGPDRTETHLSDARFALAPRVLLSVSIVSEPGSSMWAGRFGSDPAPVRSRLPSPLHFCPLAAQKLRTSCINMGHPLAPMKEHG